MNGSHTPRGHITASARCFETQSLALQHRPLSPCDQETALGGAAPCRECPADRRGQPRALRLAQRGGSGNGGAPRPPPPLGRVTALRTSGCRFPPRLPPSLCYSLLPPAGSRLLPALPTAQQPAAAAASSASSISGHRASSPSLLPFIRPPAAMELPESQCKKAKLSNRVPNWVSGRAGGRAEEWGGERRRGGRRGQGSEAMWRPGWGLPCPAAGGMGRAAREPDRYQSGRALPQAASPRSPPWRAPSCPGEPGLPLWRGWGFRPRRLLRQHSSSSDVAKGRVKKAMHNVGIHTAGVARTEVLCMLGVLWKTVETGLRKNLTKAFILVRKEGGYWFTVQTRMELFSRHAAGLHWAHLILLVMQGK